MKKQNFAKAIEKLVNPVHVGTLHFIQSFNSMLPKSVQSFLIKSSSKKTPYMGFVVEPYSLFLCYEIIDVKKAQSLIPNNFKLIKTSIFAGDEPKYYCIFGCFKAHTSAFWGARTEFYVIAQNKDTNLLSWVIVDYDTNTISYDQKSGLRSPNATNSIMTIDHRGTIYIDVTNDQNKRHLALSVNIENEKMHPLDQRLWLEGNLSVGYGSDLSDTGDIFALKFEPCEVEKALFIPVSKLNLEANTWHQGLYKETPHTLACFPYAQHFLSDSPGQSSFIKNEEELVKSINKINFDEIKVFDTSFFKKMLIINAIISFVITAVLVILLIIK